MNNIYYIGHRQTVYSRVKDAGYQHLIRNEADFGAQLLQVSEGIARIESNIKRL